jgi:hypothetical protein
MREILRAAGKAKASQRSRTSARSDNIAGTKHSSTVLSRVGNEQFRSAARRPSVELVPRPSGPYRRQPFRNGVRDHQPPVEQPYCPRLGRPPVWHIERCRNARRLKQYFDCPTWSSRRMRSFTRSRQPALRNHTVIPSTNSSVGTAPNRVMDYEHNPWHSVLRIPLCESQISALRH